MIRAKFRCESKTQYANGVQVNLRAVTSGSKEYEEFFKWTPSGNFEMGTLNAAAAAQFEPGKSYHLDFTTADE